MKVLKVDVSFHEPFEKRPVNYRALGIMICTSLIQGGEDPQDALSLYVIFRKRAPYFVALLREMTCN